MHGDAALLARPRRRRLPHRRDPPHREGPAASRQPAELDPRAGLRRAAARPRREPRRRARVPARDSRRARRVRGAHGRRRGLHHGSVAGRELLRARRRASPRVQLLVPALALGRATRLRARDRALRRARSGRRLARLRCSRTTTCPRHATRYDDPVLGDARARVAAMLLLTLRGTPFLYYGEEIGMRNVEVPREQHARSARAHAAPEPVARPGAHADALERRARTPASPAATPWLPIGADVAKRNVATQREDRDSLLWLYRDLLALRRGDAGAASAAASERSRRPTACSPTSEAAATRARSSR